jgi:hypothetical protein
MAACFVLVDPTPIRKDLAPAGKTEEDQDLVDRHGDRLQSRA